MTVMAAEAAPAAAGAGTAAGARAATGRGRRARGVTRTVERRREPIDSDRGGTRYVTTTTTRRGGRAQRRVTERRREPGQIPGSTIDTTTTTETGGRGRVPRQRISRGNYQAVILVEFVAAVVLTAATPVATGKGKPGLSPYAGSDIVKLMSLTVLYLILAMMSVGGRSWGRVAAWLGGLILLTDGLFEASNIARDLQLIGGGGKPRAKAAQPAGGIVPTPSGQPGPNLTGSTGQA